MSGDSLVPPVLIDNVVYRSLLVLTPILVTLNLILLSVLVHNLVTNRKDGMFGIGSSAGHLAERSDSGAFSMGVLRNDRHHVVEGLGAYEAPVYWPQADPTLARHDRRAHIDELDSSAAAAEEKLVEAALDAAEKAAAERAAADAAMNSASPATEGLKPRAEYVRRAGMKSGLSAGRVNGQPLVPY
jgi:hypothetical protein